MTTCLTPQQRADRTAAAVEAAVEAGRGLGLTVTEPDSVLWWGRSPSRVSRMPLVEVTYAPTMPEPQLRELGSVLPHLVSLAVECPEEPYDGELQPGDVEIRFRPLSPLDRSGLPVVIEIKSKWSASREANRQERVDALHADIRAATGLVDFGVYLLLPSAAWSQGD